MNNEDLDRVHEVIDNNNHREVIIHLQNGTSHKGILSCTYTSDGNSLMISLTVDDSFKGKVVTYLSRSQIIGITVYEGTDENPFL